MLNKFSASVAAPLRPLPAYVPSVPDVTPADQPMSSAPTDFVLHTINREVTAQAKEKAWRDQMAADDLLAAATAAARAKYGGAASEKNIKYQTNLENVRLQGHHRPSLPSSKFQTKDQLLLKVLRDETRLTLRRGFAHARVPANYERQAAKHVEGYDYTYRLRSGLASAGQPNRNCRASLAQRRRCHR